MIEKKLVYSGPSSDFYNYETFLEFMSGHVDRGIARFVIQDNGYLDGGIVKIQIYHVEPHVTLVYDDRESSLYDDFSNVKIKRHVFVELYGDPEKFGEVEKIILAEARKYSSIDVPRIPVDSYPQ